MARSERIYIRVTPEEKANFQKLANKDNRSLSDYIRLSILKNIKGVMNESKSEKVI